MLAKSLVRSRPVALTLYPVEVEVDAGYGDTMTVNRRAAGCGGEGVAGIGSARAFGEFGV